MSDNSLNIPDVPPEGFFGDLQEFQAWLVKRHPVEFTPRHARKCPVAVYLAYKHDELFFVELTFIRDLFSNYYLAPIWMKKIISRIDLDCGQDHNPREYITAARVLELSKA